MATPVAGLREARVDRGRRLVAGGEPARLVGALEQRQPAPRPDTHELEVVGEDRRLDRLRRDERHAHLRIAEAEQQVLPAGLALRVRNEGRHVRRLSQYLIGF